MCMRFLVVEDLKLTARTLPRPPRRLADVGTNEGGSMAVFPVVLRFGAL